MSSQKPVVRAKFNQRPYRALIAITLITLAAALTLLGLAAFGKQTRDESAAVPMPAVENSDLPENTAAAAILASDWWQTVRADIQAAEYHINWQDMPTQPDEPAAYQG